MVLIRCIPMLDKMKIGGDEQINVNIVKKSLEEPMQQIVNNAGLERLVIVDKVKKSDKPNYGFAAQKEEYVDMLAAGIIDPTKLTRSTLQNASSVASLMLTTEVMITDMPEEKGGGIY